MLHCTADAQNSVRAIWAEEHLGHPGTQSETPGAPEHRAKGTSVGATHRMPPFYSKGFSSQPADQVRKLFIMDV